MNCFGPWLLGRFYLVPKVSCWSAHRHLSAAHAVNVVCSFWRCNWFYPDADHKTCHCRVIVLSKAQSFKVLICTLALCELFENWFQIPFSFILISIIWNTMIFFVTILLDKASQLFHLCETCFLQFETKFLMPYYLIIIWRFIQLFDNSLFVS